MGALLSAGIPIPQALDGLGEEEESPALKAVVLKISDSVRKGASFSAALDDHPRLFSKLYVNMVRVGEERRHFAEKLLAGIPEAKKRFPAGVSTAGLPLALTAVYTGATPGPTSATSRTRTATLLSLLTTIWPISSSLCTWPVTSPRKS